MQLALNPPLFQRRIKEPNRCTNSTHHTYCCRVSNPQILDRATIEYPAEMQFSFSVVNRPTLAIARKLAIPSADKTVEGLSFFSERRMGSTRRKHIDHRLWRRRAAVFWLRGSLSNRNCAKSQDEHEACDSDLERFRSDGVTHASSLLALTIKKI